LVGNSLGRIFRVTTWGESHGLSMGCVIDGCPAGLRISDLDIRTELDRDTPFPVLSSRLEENSYEILSGVFEDLTTGTPISIIIENGNVKSESYRDAVNLPRPGHADLSYRLKYGHVDWRGGSRASGRTWITVVAAGAIARKLCSHRGILIRSRIVEMGGRPVEGDDPSEIVDEIAEECRRSGDSSGGMIEVEIINPPPGLGAPAFSRFHADLGHAILNIPGVRSFELGNSREASSIPGSENNDQIGLVNGRMVHSSNNSGGVLGGITTGEPVTFRAVVKPTPSVLRPQKTVDLAEMKDAEIRTRGRFDMNYTPRVLVIAESLSAIVTADHLMLSGMIPHDSLIPAEERLEYLAMRGGREV
jgi:chorismate synthase